MFRSLLKRSLSSIDADKQLSWNLGENIYLDKKQKYLNSGTPTIVKKNVSNKNFVLIFLLRLKC